MAVDGAREYLDDEQEEREEREELAEKIQEKKCYQSFHGGCQRLRKVLESQKLSGLSIAG